MTQRKNLKPTAGELEILQVLWRHGPSTVRFVNDRLNESKEVGYTTTLKLMQLMFDKGILERDTSQRSHIYWSLLAEQETQGALLDRFLETAFSGSALKLVMQVLGNRDTSEEEIEQIRIFLDDLERDKR
ncbi:BlaI/MecI/CopY family transcriptional regulator [bacterium]|nr:BlaI/MecI/CopY family transcriptional regulator [bacterium]